MPASDNYELETGRKRPGNSPLITNLVEVDPERLREALESKERKQEEHRQQQQAILDAAWHPSGWAVFRASDVFENAPAGAYTVVLVAEEKITAIPDHAALFGTYQDENGFFYSLSDAIKVLGRMP